MRDRPLEQQVGELFDVCSTFLHVHCDICISNPLSVIEQFSKQTQSCRPPCMRGWWHAGSPDAAAIE